MSRPESSQPWSARAALAFPGNAGPPQAELNQPTDVVVDIAGNLYIAEFNNRIRKVTAPTGIITTPAGSGPTGYFGSGGFSRDCGLATLYIADLFNGRIRKVDLSGIITTVAGNGTQGYSGDGGPTPSRNSTFRRGGSGQRGQPLHRRRLQQPYP